MDSAQVLSLRTGRRLATLASSVFMVSGKVPCSVLAKEERGSLCV